jgi:processive 1,2-diacylglycerol beta-glucosyltransferase
MKVQHTLLEGVGGYLLERSGAMTLAEQVAPALAAKLDPALLPSRVQGAAAEALAGTAHLGITADTPHQKVLIMTMGVTGGHNALARSVGAQIERQYPGAQVVIADGATISGEVFDSPVGNAMQKFHTYERTDQPWIYDTRYRIRSTDGGTRGGRRIYDGMFREDVKRVIETERPDVIVSTHPAVTATLGRMRSLGILETPTVAALNDAAPNGLWLAPGIDEHVFYVPNDIRRLPRTFAAREGQQLHASLARPPIEQKVVTLEQQHALRADLGLPADRPVLVVSSGSMGIPVADDTYRRLLAETDAHVVVATGSNAEMQAHLAATFPADRLTSLGFTKRMQDYIDASDGVMLKAHGATFLEAASAHKPVLFFEPEGGHARASVRALARDGYATLPATNDDLISAVQQLREPASQVRMTAARADELFAGERSYADVIMHATPKPAVV